MRSRRPWSLAGVVILLALLGGCGVDPVSALGSDASPTELNAAFSECPFPEADHAPALEFLASPVQWFEVMESSVDTSNLDVSEPVEAEVTVKSGEDEKNEIITAHHSYWPGINWALTNGGSAWVAIGDPKVYEGTNFVVYVIAYNQEGKAFFPGDCQALFLYEPLSQNFGSDLEAVIDDMTGVTGPELAARLGLDASDTSTESIVLLNPEDVTPEFLASLQFALPIFQSPNLYRVA